MKGAILLVVLAALSLSFAQQVSINYGVQFNETNGQCGGTDRATITVMVPLYNTIQSVMEAAVLIDPIYRFRLEYSSTYAGYIVSELVSVSNTDRCRWMVYISAPGFNDESLVNGAIDRFHVPNNYTVILRYEMGVATITTYYKIEYPDSMCSNSSNIPSASVTTQENPTALDVMESAALMLGERYQFSVVYESSSSNYVVQHLNGNERTTQCMWMAFYFESRGGTENLITGSVANFHIPVNNAELILRFREEMLPTTASPVMAATTGAAQGQHGVSAVLMVVPVIMFLIFSLAF